MRKRLIGLLVTVFTLISCNQYESRDGNFYKFEDLYSEGILTEYDVVNINYRFNYKSVLDANGFKTTNYPTEAIKEIPELDEKVADDILTSYKKDYCEVNSDNEYRLKQSEYLKIDDYFGCYNGYYGVIFNHLVEHIPEDDIQFSIIAGYRFNFGFVGDEQIKFFKYI